MKLIVAVCAALLAVACSEGEPGPYAGGKLGQPARIEAAVKGPKASLQEAMDADRAFSDYAQTAGMAEAFATYMDAVEGMMISPGDVTTGSDAIREGFAAWPDDLKMTWAPDGGFGSASGDLAVTTGRYTRTRNGETVGTGRYVTAWRKNSDGDWKGVIDLGAPDPAPTTGEQE